MTKKMASSRVIIGLFLILLGAVLVLCSRPYFSYTIEKLEQVQRSDTILNSSFNLDESQDKLIKVQLIIGQTLDILASGSDNFTFLLANYTDPENVTALNEPDITYYILNGTLNVNTTWTPQSRTNDPGDYYLVFLARDISAESPVQVYADITKRWTDLQTKTAVAPDLKALIDSNYLFVGLGAVVLGVTVLVHTFYYMRQPRSRRSE